MQQREVPASASVDVHMSLKQQFGKCCICSLQAQCRLQLRLLDMYRTYTLQSLDSGSQLLLPSEGQYKR